MQSNALEMWIEARLGNAKATTPAPQWFCTVVPPGLALPPVRYAQTPYSCLQGVGLVKSLWLYLGALHVQAAGRGSQLYARRGASKVDDKTLTSADRRPTCSLDRDLDTLLCCLQQIWSCDECAPLGNLWTHQVPAVRPAPRFSGLAWLNARVAAPDGGGAP